MKTKLIAARLVKACLIFPAAFAVAAEPLSPAPKEEEKAAEAATQLENAKKVLAQMRTRYREAHPRVKEQLRKIAELERELAPKK